MPCPAAPLYSAAPRNSLFDEKSAFSGDETQPGDLHPDLQLYHEHYQGVTRGQLQKRDNPLYQRLRTAGLREHIPKKHRVISDLLAY